MLKKLSLFILALLGSSSAFAEAVTLGTVAKNALIPVDGVAKMLSTASIIVGLGCLLGALVHYRLYRTNPLQAKLSTVWTLIILGTLLILLPLAYLLNTNQLIAAFNPPM